jgi:hypothetical protein
VPRQQPTASLREEARGEARALQSEQEKKQATLEKEAADRKLNDDKQAEMILMRDRNRKQNPGLGVPRAAPKPGPSLAPVYSGKTLLGM